MTKCQCGELAPTTSAASRCSGCGNSSYYQRAFTTPFAGGWFCGIASHNHSLNPEDPKDFRCVPSDVTAATAAGVKTGLLALLAADAIFLANKDFISDEINTFRRHFKEAIRMRSMEILGVKTDGEYKAAEFLIESTKMTPEKHSATLIRLALSPSYLAHISITSLTASQNILYHLITPTIASYLIKNRSSDVQNNDFHMFPGITFTHLAFQSIIEHSLRRYLGSGAFDNTEVTRVLAVRRIRDCGGGLPFPENADDQENVWPHSLHETSIALNRCLRDDPLAPTPPSKLSSTPRFNLPKLL